MRGVDDFKRDRARDLRKRAPSAEQALWARLRNRKLGGFKFARQQPIGPYFVDFVCRDRKRIIEIDGATHSTDAEIARDRSRAAFLESLGYAITRFQNIDVFENIDGVVETILARLEGRETL